MDKKRIKHYLLLTFAITWSFWWGLAILTQKGLVDASQGIYTLLHLIGGFGPTFAAIAVLQDKSPKTLISFVFSQKKNTLRYLLLFCIMETVSIWLSSMELNSALPLSATPVVLLSATFLGGGNEEIGWRGILQPELEKRFSFPIATIITGCIWMLWHVPLWFVVGASQQNMHFGLYSIYGLLLSFWLAAIYRKTGSVFFCAVFHGLSNLLLSLFIIKINWILVAGLLLTLSLSLFLLYQDEKHQQA